MSKSLFKSKMFWVNAAGILIDLSGMISGGYVLTALSVVNIGLRLITNKPVHIIGPLKESNEQVRAKVHPRRTR